MSTNNDDLEQECEDALFELCDVRERYPAKCAAELEQCLQLITRINMKPSKRNVIERVDEILITDEQEILFQDFLKINKENSEKWKLNNNQIEQMLSDIDNLRIVIEQIKNAELCPISCMTKVK